MRAVIVGCATAVLGGHFWSTGLGLFGPEVTEILAKRGILDSKDFWRFGVGGFLLGTGKWVWAFVGGLVASRIAGAFHLRHAACVALAIVGWNALSTLTMNAWYTTPMMRSANSWLILRQALSIGVFAIAGGAVARRWPAAGPRMVRPVSKKMIWAPAVIGFLLSMGLHLVASTLHYPPSFSLSSLPGYLTFSLWASVPFLFWGLFARWLLRRTEVRSAAYRPRLVGLWVCGAAVSVVVCRPFLGYWSHAMTGDRLPSTAMIAFAVQPYGAVLAGMFAYPVGWLLGKVFFRLR